MPVAKKQVILFYIPLQIKPPLNKIKHIGMGKNRQKIRIKPGDFTQPKKRLPDKMHLLRILIAKTRMAALCKEGLRERRNWEGENM